MEEKEMGKEEGERRGRKEPRGLVVAPCRRGAAWGKPSNDKPSHRRRAYRLELSGKPRAHLREERREEQANIAEHGETVTSRGERCRLRYKTTFSAGRR